MKIHLQLVQDFDTFETYFGDDAPQRKMDFFILAHTDHLGILKAASPPATGEALVWKDKEYMVLNRLWEFSDTNEYVVKLLLGEIEDEAGEMS